MIGRNRRAIAGYYSANYGVVPSLGSTGSVLDMFLPKDQQGKPIATVNHTVDAKGAALIFLAVLGGVLIANKIS